MYVANSAMIMHICYARGGKSHYDIKLQWPYFSFRDIWIFLCDSAFIIKDFYFDVGKLVWIRALRMGELVSTMIEWLGVNWISDLPISHKATERTLRKRGKRFTTKWLWFTWCELALAFHSIILRTDNSRDNIPPPSVWSDLQRIRCLKHRVKKCSECFRWILSILRP